MQPGAQHACEPQYRFEFTSGPATNALLEAGECFLQGRRQVFKPVPGAFMTFEAELQRHFLEPFEPAGLTEMVFIASSPSSGDTYTIRFTDGELKLERFLEETRLFRLSKPAANQILAAFKRRQLKPQFQRQAPKGGTYKEPGEDTGVSGDDSGGGGLGLEGIGCSGGSNHELNLTWHDKPQVKFKSSSHCSGDSSGDLSGDLEGFADDLSSMIPAKKAPKR